MKLRARLKERVITGPKEGEEESYRNKGEEEDETDVLVEGIHYTTLYQPSSGMVSRVRWSSSSSLESVPATEENKNNTNNTLILMNELGTHYIIGLSGNTQSLYTL